MLANGHVEQRQNNASFVFQLFAVSVCVWGGVSRNVSKMYVSKKGSRGDENKQMQSYPGKIACPYEPKDKNRQFATDGDLQTDSDFKNI